MLIDVEGKNFKSEVFKNANLTFVCFSAVWCGPCQLLHPILESLSDELDGEIDFYAVDADEAPDICSYYDMTAVPTVIAFKECVEVDRFTGLKNENEVRDFIAKCKM